MDATKYVNLSNQSFLEPLQRFSDTKPAITAFSDNSVFLAIFADAKVSLWNVGGGAPTRVSRFVETADGRAIAVWNDRNIAYSSLDGGLMFVRRNHPPASVPVPRPADADDFHFTCLLAAEPDRDVCNYPRLIAGTSHGHIYIFNTNTGEHISRSAMGASIGRMAVNPDASWLACSYTNADGANYVFACSTVDLESAGTYVHPGEGGRECTDIRFTSIGSSDGFTTVWKTDWEWDVVSVETGTLRQSHGRLLDAMPPSIMIASPDPGSVAYARGDVVHLCNRSSIRLDLKQSGPIIEMAFSANKRWIATANTDHTVRLWDLGRRGFMAAEFFPTRPDGVSGPLGDIRITFSPIIGRDFSLSVATRYRVVCLKCNVNW